MANLHLLPLGTVVKPKDVNPEVPEMRYMIVGYFPMAADKSVCFDYSVVPWPLGYVNLRGGIRKINFSCNEDAIGSVDYLGGVNEELAEKLEVFYEEAIGRDDLSSPLARGSKPMATEFSFGLSNFCSCEPTEGDILPLGTIVSVEGDSKKVMIYQHLQEIKGSRHDYGICAWPDGADPGLNGMYVADSSQITAVHFRGYENALSQERLKELKGRSRGSLFSRIIGKVSEW